MFLKMVLLGAAIMVSGCAGTNTGAMAAGSGTYVLSRQAGAFPSGKEPLLAEALAEGNEKCAGLNKSMKLVSTNENPGPYILGNYPKATIIFSCI